MKKSIKQWIVTTFISAVLGFLAGYGLLWMWYLLGLFACGYGDSGPSWMNLVNDVVFYAGLAGFIAAGQVLFFFKQRKKMNDDYGSPGNDHE